MFDGVEKGNRKKPPATDGKPGKDFGPLIRLSATTMPTLPPELPPGATEAEQIAYRQARAALVWPDMLRIVEKEDRIDPNSTTGALVRGGRVRDPLAMMFSLRTITKAQFDAAEAFRDDIEIANGARPFQPDDAGVRGPIRYDGILPANTRLNAMRRVITTWELLTGPQRLIVKSVLVERKSLDLVATELRVRRQTAPELLKEVLNLLEFRHNFNRRRQGG